MLHTPDISRYLHLQKNRDVDKKAIHQNTRPGKFAYVTLLFEEDDLPGVRVLGQSLRQSGTTSDLVCIAIQVSSRTKATLEREQWSVLSAKQIEDPSHQLNRKAAVGFQRTAAKLGVFNLPYEKVIFLECDTLVLKNVDKLFECGGRFGYCATLRQSNVVDPGVFVLTPSLHVHELLVNKLLRVDDGEDAKRDAISEFFQPVKDLPLYPSAFTSYKWEELRSLKNATFSLGQFERLPIRYNADVELFVLNSGKWPLPEESLHIIHFSIRALRPWRWWSVWILKPAMYWWKVESQLPVSAEDRWRSIVLFLLSAIPFVSLLATYFFLPLRCMSAFQSTLHRNKLNIFAESTSSASSGAVKVLLRFLLFVLCLALAIWLVVPSWAPPTLGWLLVYEWSMISYGIVLFFLLLQDTLCNSRLNLSSTFTESPFVKSGTLLQGLNRQVFQVVMSPIIILSMVFGSIYAMPLLATDFSTRLILIVLATSAGSIVFTSALIKVSANDP